MRELFLFDNNTMLYVKGSWIIKTEFKLRNTFEE